VQETCGRADRTVLRSDRWEDTRPLWPVCGDEIGAESGVGWLTSPWLLLVVGCVEPQTAQVGSWPWSRGKRMMIREAPKGRECAPKSVLCRRSPCVFRDRFLELFSIDVWRGRANSGAQPKGRGKSEWKTVEVRLECICRNAKKRKKKKRPGRPYVQACTYIFET
jgi:hypothetical protein